MGITDQIAPPSPFLHSAVERVLRFWRKMQRRYRAHPAQGLVEFALALPILLLLIFGIIEFARALQAWLALQNGARFAVRTAITGSYDIQYCNEAASALGLTAEDNLDGQIDCKVPDRYPAGHPQAGQEVPHFEEFSSRLQDWARLPTIRDAALAGAYGLDWNPDTAVSGDYLAFLTRAYDDRQTCSGLPCPDERGNPAASRYFNISMCSNRIYPLEGEDLFGDDNSHFAWDPNPFYLAYPPGADPEQYRFPIHCGQYMPDNSSVRYIDDAGGPGDRVRIVLTYRHALITPIISNWWPTLRLTAQREGIVERFRTSRVTGLTGAIGMAATWTSTPTNTVPPTLTYTPTLTATPATCQGTGSILRQVWFNLPCTYGMECLTSSSLNPSYPANPSQQNYPTSFDAPENIADYYGTRMFGYVCPPYTGDYTFFISSNNISQLYLSSSQNPAGAALIASVPNYSDYHYHWNKYSSQRSTTITLQGGQLYYIEARHIENAYSDWLAVGWTGPGIAENPVVIQGQYLVPGTPLPTQEPTATPQPNCDVLINLGDPERLTIDDGGDDLESFLFNSSQNYQVRLTGAQLSFNGAWHNQRQSPAVPVVFDRYPNIFDPANITLPLNRTTTFSHSFSSPPLINPLENYTFAWDFIDVFHLNGYNPVPTDYQTYYWPSDFNGIINYQVGSLNCTMNVTGGPGPDITVTSSAGALPVTFGGPFWIRADPNWRGLYRNYVYMYVYDSSGTLVHWRRNGAAGSTCIFGGDGSIPACNTRTPYVDFWSLGSDRGPLIVNGDYTLVVLARGETDLLPDYVTRKKSNMIVRTFRIQAPTPTATNVPPPTRTFTVTPIPSSTGTRTNTPLPSATFTNTPIPTVTRTPTVTSTRTNTVIPTVTHTLSPSRTPTQCQTPIELGGCQ